jgi:uncharacterized protein YigE (DUF2233 family)
LGSIYGAEEGAGMKMIDLRHSLPKHAWRRYPKRKKEEIEIIALHHSLTEEGSAEAFARYHVSKYGWPGIGYAYVIGKDGTVYICHDIETMTYHVGNSNRKSIGICLVGDFRTQKPTPAQYQAALELVRELQRIIPHTVIKGHSELPGYSWKQCPVIDMTQFRKDVEVSTLDIIHTRTRWTSWTGVEFVPLNYSGFKAEDGWTDIRYCVIPDGYEMDILIDHNKTVPEIAQGYDLAINGPFFYAGKPIGYIVKDGKLLNDTVSAQKWADFIAYDDGRMDIGQLDKTRLEDIKLAFTSTPRIVVDGKIHMLPSIEGTPKDVVTGRRPRSAIGIREDGKLIVCVVDGNSKWDAGLRIDELAAVMIKLGAVQALNLDGGGSSVMVHQGKAITPNKGTRKTGSAIVFKHHCS